MKSRRMLTILVMALGLMVWAPRISKAGPMGTAWTYQGRLIDADSAADGKYDFTFKLFNNAPPTGIQQGSTINVSKVDVNDGYFKVELDFGSVVFASGDARWLEIGVRRTGSMGGGFTTLNPRQEVTPAPYALYALNGAGGTGFWAANGSHIYNTNSGNVGIGTSSPAGRLHVGTAANYGTILFFDAGGGQNDLSIDPDSAYTDNIDRIYIVEVSSSAGSPDKFKWSDDSGGTWSSALDMTTNWYDLSHGVRIKWDNVNGHDDGGALPGDTWAWVAVHSDENALVVKDGKVGIGTSSPEWELEVANMTAGDGAESAVTADDASGAIAAYSSTLGAPFEHYGGRVSLFSDAVTMGLDLRADGSTGDMRFYTGGPWPANEKMRITDTGNVGIGTVNPFAKLSVGGDGYEFYDITIYGEAVDGVGVWGVTSSVGPDDWGAGVLGEGSGSYGVGVIAAGGAFDFYADGPGYDYGSGSSIRWKRNIVEIDNPLEKLVELRGVYFDWDEEHGGRHGVGMIAEEVGKVLPEIVIYEENGIDAKGMDYSKLTPLLVEAIKALKEQADERKSELAEKEVEIAGLKDRLSKLETMVTELSLQQGGGI